MKSPASLLARTCPCVLLVLVGLTTGCSASRFSAAQLEIPLVDRGLAAAAPDYFDPDEAAANDAQPDPHALPMFLGSTGEVLAWGDVRRASRWADVIFIGEEHDDAVGHAVQLAVVQDVTERFDDVALSMEMLERDEQRLVDDYLDDIIDAEDFAKLTHSEKWAGEGSWANWYQPIIDAVKDDGGRVIAANAPRRYVRLARSHGFERLRDLPRERRDFVALPKGSLDTPYRDRFVALMSDMSDSDDEDADAHRMPSDAVLAMFRSQITWDATMAESIAEALKRSDKVVHLAGRFHIGFDGGTVEQFRLRRPGARVLTIVMSKDDALSLREEDRGLADIVIYTGKRLEKDEEDEQADDADEEDATEGPSPAADDPESPPTDRPDEPDAR